MNEFRRLIAGPEPVYAPLVFNPVSALLAQPETPTSVAITAIPMLDLIIACPRKEIKKNDRRI